MSNNTLRRLTKSNFNRPETTYQDTLQNKKSMMEKLKGYQRVDDIEDVSINTHVRYVTLDKEKNQVFRLGGLLTAVHRKYVKLSNGTYEWSVQRYHYDDAEETQSQDPIFETVFWKIIPKNVQLKTEISKKDAKIKELEKKLAELT